MFGRRFENGFTKVYLVSFLLSFFSPVFLSHDESKREVYTDAFFRFQGRSRKVISPIDRLLFDSEVKQGQVGTDNVSLFFNGVRFSRVTES